MIDEDSTGNGHVEAWMRDLSSPPDGPRETVLARLHELEAAGIVDDTAVHVWKKSISDGTDLCASVGRARSERDLQQPDRGPAYEFFGTCNRPVGIVGGGYIGVEMTEALAATDFEVHLFQRGDWILGPFKTAQ